MNIINSATRSVTLILASVLFFFSVTSVAADASPATAAPADKALTKVIVGILPITSTAALRLGIEKGFFTEEGLDVETRVAQSGAALVPAVTSGQYQYAFANYVSLLLAYGRGLPVRIVRGANSIGSDPSPSQEGLFTGKNSGITSVEQLSGKTIAVNSVNNLPHMSVLETLAKAGVDPATVKFVELGFPDMPLALSERRVDAADISEPFATQAEDEGAIRLVSAYRQVAQDLPLSGWFSSQNYIDQAPDAVAAFGRAVDRSNKYAEENPGEIRKFISANSKIDPHVAETMALPGFPQGSPSVEILSKIMDLMVKFGVVNQGVEDIGGILAHYSSSAQ